MKTIKEIKNHYAQELGCKDWQDLIMKTWSDDDMEKYYDEICIRAQKLALEKAAEYFDMYWNKSVITNEQNLIR